jgi:hypothetical protein
MTASKFTKGLLAAAAAVALAGTAMAQGNPPNPAVKSAPVGAGQQSSQQTPMGTTGTPTGGSAAPTGNTGTGTAMGTKSTAPMNSGTSMGASSTSADTSANTNASADTSMKTAKRSMRKPRADRN